MHRPTTVGALYTTLDRLEAKGLVKTWMGDPTPERGGRPKRMVRVTAKRLLNSRLSFSRLSFRVPGDATTHTHDGVVEGRCLVNAL
jgi:hypothetical protein